jgi:glycosyltransferase involved in cell wall biosynthesis
MPKFSIVLPVYSELEPKQAGASGQTHFRGKTVQRAIKSVMAQQFKDWELIIVDDGCVDNITPRILDAFADMDKRIKVIHKENENRAIARNTGMDAATGEWLCWLDSDDEYTTHYLRQLDKATKEFPEYKIFNFRTIYQWPDYNTQINNLFEPAVEGKGHEWFRAGHITCGGFIFKRELWASDKKYRIPDEASPFSFAAESKFPYRLTREEDQWKYDNTENPDGMFQDGVFRQGSSLGNPWGDDALQLYLLTRDNLTKPLNCALYITYPRTSEDNYTDFGEVFDVET